MAKNTNDESAEPTVTNNRKKLVTAGWIAGGVLALGATFAAGAAVGHVSEGLRGGDRAEIGHSEMMDKQGPKGMHGEHRGHGPMGERGAHKDMRP